MPWTIRVRTTDRQPETQIVAEAIAVAATTARIPDAHVKLGIRVEQ
jgi:hypothetical protein